MKAWKDLFQPRILERGLDYYEKGQVVSLEETADGYLALVQGSEDYTVQIEINQEQVADMTCTCPYAADGKYCKHMAAVLYQIEEEKAEVEKEKGHILGGDNPRKSRKAELEEAVAAIPEKQLRELMVSWAGADISLYNQIIMQYAPVTERRMVGLKRQVERIGYEYSDRSGFINYYQASDYADALSDLLNKTIHPLIKQNCRMEAFELVNCVVQEIGNRDIDDSDGFMGYLAEKCYEYWKEILQICNEEEEETMFQWFQSHRRNFVIDFIEEYIDSFLMNEFHDERYLREKLNWLDELIDQEQKEHNRSNWYADEYERIEHICTRISLMKELDYPKSEIRTYRKRYRGFPEIRKMEVEEYLSEKDYEKAIKVLKESKRKDRKFPGLLEEYSRKLIDIYEQQNMQKEYAEELTDLVFQYAQHNLSYIMKLKKICSAEEWEKQREKLLASKRSVWIRYKLLAEEGMLERLLSEIRQQGSVQVVDQYEETLKKQFPNELRDIYVQYINNAVQQLSDRNGYRDLIAYLKKILKYPDGKRVAGEIAEKWKMDYKRRRAMMEELQKAGF